MRLRALWKPLLGRLTLLLAQSEEDARRWRQIGAPAERVVATGNLKYDIRTAGETPLTVLVRKHLPSPCRILLCGSTHDGEESLLLDCWKSLPQSDRLMILAPRHPERTAAVEQLAADRKIIAIRLSQWRLAPSEIPPHAILLVDTVGELSSLYTLASVAFIGGSLIPHGGQNPLEAARFGVPVVMGPSYENFRGMVDAMVAAQAIQRVTRQTLCAALQQLLSGSHDDDLGERGRAFAASMTGATERTVAALTHLLDRSAR
jgi:3-deoxy-D-manno-octulosonic-acid transferase